MFRVMVAEADSATRTRICRTFASDAQLRTLFRVVAVNDAPDGAARLAAVLKPDVLLLNMGLSHDAAVVKHVMYNAPTRILAYAQMGSATTETHLRQAVEH